MPFPSLRLLFAGSSPRLGRCNYLAWLNCNYLSWGCLLKATINWLINSAVDYRRRFPDTVCFLRKQPQARQVQLSCLGMLAQLQLSCLGVLAQLQLSCLGVLAQLQLSFLGVLAQSNYQLAHQQRGRTLLGYREGKPIV